MCVYHTHTCVNICVVAALFLPVVFSDAALDMHDTKVSESLKETRESDGKEGEEREDRVHSAVIGGAGGGVADLFITTTTTPVTDVQTVSTLPLPTTTAVARTTSTHAVDAAPPAAAAPSHAFAVTVAQTVSAPPPPTAAAALPTTYRRKRRRAVTRVHDELTEGKTNDSSCISSEHMRTDSRVRRPPKHFGQVAEVDVSAVSTKTKRKRTSSEYVVKSIIGRKDEGDATHYLVSWEDSGTYVILR
eukprot:GHVU01059119.1.p1 GENE.GHVU01059119.1~~GHVU01059119.1.p1  ORF type:complete len:246 (+),score=31.16 GHVU01059119.1:178-915(+)